MDTSIMTNPELTNVGVGQSLCAGCGSKIYDRELLNALDRLWHTGCLKCSYCHLALSDLGTSFYVKANMILCKNDYIKMYGQKGRCARCASAIPADQLVMRCQGSVYHLDCFVCTQCNMRLVPGQKFSLVNGSIFCEHEFPRLFASGIPSDSSTASLSNQSNSAQLNNGTQNSIPNEKPTGKGKQKKVNSRRYPLPVC